MVELATFSTKPNYGVGFKKHIQTFRTPLVRRLCRAVHFNLPQFLLVPDFAKAMAGKHLQTGTLVHFLNHHHRVHAKPFPIGH
jgi:hypothetical protein